MKILLRMTILLCLLAELGGCKALLKKRDPEPAPSAAPLVVAPPAVTSVAPVVPMPVASAAPAVAPPVLNEAAVPTTQDFEDEAFTKITAKNFKAEFAILKTAISK